MGKGNVYKRIVLGLMDKMQYGSLRLTSGGEEWIFGKKEGINAEIEIHDELFFKKVVLFGDIGFGEAYMEGLWETPDLTQVISWFVRNMESLPGMSGSKRAFNPINLLKYSNRLMHVLNPNSVSGSRKNILKHYDLSNEFFSLFLDPTMTYSSGLYEEHNVSLETAQKQKFDSLCRSMKIKDTDHVLEIGCGWGGFALYAAKNYGCSVTGITISREQYEHAVQKVNRAGMQDRVSILMKDYRKLEGKFDKVVSIEMIEAVGHKFLKPYFSAINRVLSKKGVLGIQAIVIPDNRYDEYRKNVDWIQKHIFPGGLLPSIQTINSTINATSNLNLYGLKELGNSYARTLRVWYENFLSNLDDIRRLGFDQQFIRKWEYYLCSCEAAFRERNINVVQMVYAHPNNPDF
jgi:cyclopropane-fatty-acyl-phospholipid synthase